MKDFNVGFWGLGVRCRKKSRRWKNEWIRGVEG